MGSSLFPQPHVEYGHPNYYAPSPIQPDGFPLSVGDWVNGFPEFDKSVQIRPPKSVVQAYGGGGSTPNHCRLALTVVEGDYARLWLTALPRPGAMQARLLAVFPPRVIEGLHLTEFLQRFPHVAPIMSTYSPEAGVAWVPESPVVSTPPDGYVKADAVRGALTLPTGVRRTYGNLRKAVEEALGT